MSSVDSSAAAWAEGTIAAAEAFAQAQADAAATERDAREQAAASGYQPPNDGVDRPSSHQRALPLLLISSLALAFCACR
jgi:hypothetical protein